MDDHNESSFTIMKKVILAHPITDQIIGSVLENDNTLKHVR